MEDLEHSVSTYHNQDEQLLLISRRNCEAANQAKSSITDSNTMSRCEAAKSQQEGSASARRSKTSVDAKLHIGGYKRSSLWSGSTGFRYTGASMRHFVGLALLLGLLSPQLRVANAWRFFDSTNPETRLYNSMQPLNFLAGPSPPVNLPSQHLRPVSSQSSLHQDQVDVLVVPTLAPQMISDQPQAVGGSSSATASQSNSARSSPSTSSDTSVRETLKQVVAEKGGELMVSLLDKLNTSSSAKLATYSPAGKIMESPQVASAPQGTSSPIPPIATLVRKPEAPAQPAEKSFQQQVASAAHQLLKPRKTAHDSSREAEQLIISQHAKLAQSSHRASSLIATKHRGGSFGDKMASGFDPSGGRDSSPLSSIISGFKSGISSRSSIVKAISDNKLARTLGEVGKTIGGNKYIAGAAAASALAALGLTVSKLLSPYLFTGGSYAKWADQMMGSGSMPIAAINTDRNYNFGHGDHMSMVGSASTLYPQTMQYGTATSRMPQMFDYGQSAPSGQVYGPMPQSTSLYQTISSEAPAQSENGYYQSYSPAPGQTVASDTRGHYTPFYSNQAPPGGLDSQSSDLSANSVNYPPYEQITNEQPPRDQLTPGGARPVQQSPASFAPDNSGINLQGESIASRYSQNPAGTSRRSGTLTLKINEATKRRLQQQFSRQQSRRHIEPQPAAPATYYQAASPSYQWLGESTFMPMAGEFGAEYAAKAPAKSNRKTPESIWIGGVENAIETANGIGDGHASLGSSKTPQQGQLVSKTSPAYMIIRPKTVPEVAGSRHQAEPNEPWPAKATGNSWRATGHSVQPLASSWQVSPASDEPPSSAAGEEQLHWSASQQAPQQVFGETKPQRSRPFLTRSNNAQEPQASRLSRPPNHSSGVKGAARRPGESSTDYGTVETVAGADGSGALKPTTSTAEPTGEASSSRLSGGQLASGGEQQQTVGSLQATTSPGSDGLARAEQQSAVPAVATLNSAEDSKTNLIKLNDGDNDNAHNNGHNVKLIESAGGSGEGSSGGQREVHYESAGSVLVVPIGEESNGHHRHYPNNHQQNHNGGGGGGGIEEADRSNDG